MDPNLALRAASVQDIQLELIRRSSFKGEQVYQGLLRNRQLWTAVLSDRPGMPYHPKLALLPADGLVKLRDLPLNEWNVNMLYVLTDSPEQARELARIAESECWGDEVRVCEDRDETHAALGTSATEHGLVSVWWEGVRVRP